MFVIAVIYFSGLQLKAVQLPLSSAKCFSGSYYEEILVLLGFELRCSETMLKSGPALESLQLKS